MGTVHSSTVVTVSGGFFISTNLIIFKEQWLTLGITASNSSSGTCTTLMATVPWTRTTLSVWPFATPSSRARETSIKPLSRRTRRSWLTCGTRSLSWLTSTRMEKFLQMDSLKESMLLVKAKHLPICHLHSNFSLTLNSEHLMLTVTALLDSQNTELTAQTGWHTKTSRILMPLTKNCSTMTTKRPVVLLWLATKNCTLNSLATLMSLAMLATSSALSKLLVEWTEMSFFSVLFRLFQL